MECEPIPLSRISLADIPLVGSKAGRLGDLLHAGFSVPDGYALPKTAVSADLVALPAAIGSIAEAFGGAPVAVRSSGVAEDLDGSSFAGQYESVLDVRGRDAMVAAVRVCWASASSSRVDGYREASGVAPESHGMGVLVQRMIDADAAGVAFSADPITGSRRDILVSAVSGLGDKLASGEVTPEDWVFTDGVLRSRPRVEGAIGPEVAAEVAALAGRVSRHYGDVPYDIEWAVRDGKLWLLQARPITGLPAAAGR